ncbi:DUF6266 family protein [Kaistella anthropi]|nr:DUF6266 family protein [Kaistella anthropi]
MKINSILIGKGSGSAGNVTVLQLKGQTILKQKATIVGNPRTEEQQNQRRMMNRAVYAWQLLGGVLRQGWTSLLPYCSEYNTYISENAQFFKDAVFTIASMTARDVVGSIATKGSLGILQATIESGTSSANSFFLNKANLNQIAKVGDKIVAVTAGSSSSEFNYGEKVVDAALLASASPEVLFNELPTELSDGAVYAIFVVSADGKNSSTSTFTYTA